MLLSELLSGQTPSKKKSSNGTVAEVFIIESLTLRDENKQRHEGAVLASVLKMCGKKPLYYYIRTKTELEKIADEFEASGYRYLHLSCHGNDTSLDTTLDPVTYVEFAKIFKDKLKGRRLFVSACSAGNELFAETVGGKNSELISVAAPAEDIDFDDAVAFWSSFYVKTFKRNAKSMNSNVVGDTLKALAVFFDAPIHFSKRDKDTKMWIHLDITTVPDAEIL